MKTIIQKQLTYLLVLALALAVTGVLGLKHPVYGMDTVPLSPICTPGTDSATTMNLSWHTGVSVKSSFLEFYQEGSATSFAAAKTQKIAARGVVTKTNGDTRLVYKAELQGLTPGTGYIYRVLTDERVASPEGRFKTAGAPGDPFTFVQITDTQGFTEAHYTLWANTLRQARKNVPDARFLLHTGDFVDSGNAIWQWDQWAAAARDDLMQIPVIPVAGNHETSNSDGSNPQLKNFVERFNTPQPPGTGAVLGSVYSFDYGSVHIAVMNTECGKENFSKQAEWLRKDMGATNKPWRIVALHRNPYGALNNTVDIRSAWTSVFDELKIDVVLGGHDHSYVRSPMKAGKRVKTGEGTTYIALNSGGVKFYPGKLRSWQVVNFQYYRQMYLGVTVTPSALNIKAFDVRNILLDEVTFRK